MHNLRLILRGLRNNRFYSFLNISGFAIGFSVVLILILFIYNELTVDHNFTDYSRIFRIIKSAENDCSLDIKIARQIEDNYPEAEAITPVQYLSGFSLNVGSEGNFITLENLISTNNQFFSIFNLKLLEGFSSQPFSESKSAVITRRLAGILFGGQTPLGKTIDVGGFITARITGVVADLPSNISFYSDLFINIEDEGNRIMQSSYNDTRYYPGNIFIKLNKGVDPDLAENKISLVSINTSGDEERLSLQPLKRIYLEKEVINNPNRIVNNSMLYLFTTIAFLILLLSVLNHVNFSVSLQFSRLREIGIKKTHGAGLKQLTFFYLTENSVSILLGFIISIFLAQQVLQPASALLESDLEFVSLYKYPVNIVVTGIIFLVILITSIAPVYMAARFDIRKFLSKDMIKSRGGGINNILSVFQATVSIILIIGVFTIHKQLSFAKGADLGFSKEHLIRLNLPGNFQKGDLVKQELGSLPFVQSATLSLGVPGIINSRAGSGEEDNHFELNCIEADEDFLETFDLKLLTGRNFFKGEQENVCILNQTALNKFGWTDIDGKFFKNLGNLKVIGVVEDFSVSSIHNEIEPAALIFLNRFKNYLTMKLIPGDVSQQVKTLKDTWVGIMPDYMFDFEFYDEYFDSLYRKEERQGLAITVFSVMALVLTLMGITGLTFQSCHARSKEIGIRKINGASLIHVISLLNKEFIRKVAVSFLIAVPLAWFIMERWLQTFAYKTKLSWWIFVLAGLLILAIVTVTVTLQSWRTATRNPVEALRYE